MPFQPTPFTVSVNPAKLEYIKSRIANYPWQAITSFDTSWEAGPPPRELKEICNHWATEYNWHTTEATINSLPNFKAQIDGMSIHFVHEKGSGPNPMPLLLLHGWPYTFHSYTHLVEKLAHPERFGDASSPAFTVIVPSLPGFTFSSFLSQPTYPREIAHVMNTLMTEVLGYEKYIAHGGDWGSYTSELLGFHYPESCVGIHITMSSVRHHSGAPRSGDYVADATDEEIAFAKTEKELWGKERSYNELMSTKPLKLNYAMMDSPVGVLAWIAEAFHSWADIRGGEKLTDVVEIDRLLDEVMLYLISDSFNTASWIYTGDYKHGSWTLPEGKRIEVPVGVLASPDPVFPMPPRKVLERSHNVVSWTAAERGGHFPMLENGDVVVQELRRFGNMARYV
jgi:microsomal epoxide hydrolase